MNSNELCKSLLTVHKRHYIIMSIIDEQATFSDNIYISPVIEMRMSLRTDSLTFTGYCTSFASQVTFLLSFVYFAIQITF
jgi:hypothetical protein